MGKILNYGWSFESWVKFWIMGEVLNHGWTFESWVNFLPLNNFLYWLQKIYSCVKFWIMGEILTICELFNHGWITTAIYYFAVLISRDQLSFYICHERTINILSSILGELLNCLWTFELLVNSELWVNFSIMGEFQLWFIILQY